MLQKIHANHLGTESHMYMARELLFWNGMCKAIKDMCENCTTCTEYDRSAPPEPMKSLPIPTRPCQIVSQDLFYYEPRYYLVTVFHFSDPIELDQLEDTLSAIVVLKISDHFPRWGNPKICHTDHGPQFTSNEYQNFVKKEKFVHSTSSPYHSQGNGKAEASVTICKNMLKKGCDLNEALGNYRNTLQRGHTYSPAQ